jgi:hypothetical protein
MRPQKLGEINWNCVPDMCGLHSAEIRKAGSRTVRSYLPCHFTQPSPPSFPTATRIHFHMFFVNVIPAVQSKTNVSSIHLVSHTNKCTNYIIYYLKSV